MAVYGIQSPMVHNYGDMLEATGIAQYKANLREIWTSWRVGEWGVERDAMTHLLGGFFDIDPLEEGLDPQDWQCAQTVRSHVYLTAKTRLKHGNSGLSDLLMSAGLQQPRKRRISGIHRHLTRITLKKKSTFGIRHRRLGRVKTE